MRKSSSIRLGLLLAAAALLSSCQEDRPPERRCVDSEGKFSDESLCAAAEATPPPDGGQGDGATGTWGEPGAAPRSGGFHFIWIPYGSFGGMGTYAAGFQRGTGTGAATSGSVSRGGFGATGAAHAGSSAGSSGSSSGAGHATAGS